MLEKRRVMLYLPRQMIIFYDDPMCYTGIKVNSSRLRSNFIFHRLHSISSFLRYSSKGFNRAEKDKSSELRQLSCPSAMLPSRSRRQQLDKRRMYSIEDKLLIGRLNRWIRAESWFGCGWVRSVTMKSKQMEEESSLLTRPSRWLCCVSAPPGTLFSALASPGVVNSDENTSTIVHLIHFLWAWLYRCGYHSNTTACV